MPREGDTLIHEAGGFEPQRTNNWMLLIHSSVIPDLSGQDIYLALKGFPFPIEANSVQRIRWYNESRTYAGSVVDFTDLNLQLHDYIDRYTANILYQWRRLVWNPTNLTVGIAARYKMDATLFLLPPNLQQVSDVDTYGRKWYCQGIWPTNFDMGALDMDGTGENVLISCSLAIDRAFPSGGSGGSAEDDISESAPRGIPPGM